MCVTETPFRNLTYVELDAQNLGDLSQLKSNVI